jgi:hypothetical protein
VRVRVREEPGAALNKATAMNMANAMTVLPR